MCQPVPYADGKGFFASFAERLLDTYPHHFS